MVKIASKKTTLSTGENTESFLIQAMSQVFTYHNEQPDFTDDCAYYQNTLPQVMSTDSICEGVHFDRKWDSLLQIGAQAAVVNLSDIAASGGQAHTLLWSLSIPPTWQVQEVIELATGFAQVAHRYHVRIRGGNLCIRPGPLEIHVTALGQTHQVIHRKGMQDQDRIYVTGYLGQRALGYLYPSQFTRTLRHQWYPHLEESQQLQQWGKVHSMMDDVL